MNFHIFALAAKAAVAAMLIVAGGAKLADVGSFASTVRLLGAYRLRRSTAQSIAVAIATAEVLIGAVSFSLPEIGWLNPAVFVVCCSFVVVSVIGFTFHRGRSCRCFGALSRRKFDAIGIVRSALIAVIASIALVRVPLTLLQAAGSARLLLGLTALVLALAARTAAQVLSHGQEFDMRLSIQ